MRRKKGRISKEEQEVDVVQTVACLLHLLVAYLHEQIASNGDEGGNSRISSTYRSTAAPALGCTYVRTTILSTYVRDFTILS